MARLSSCSTVLRISCFIVSFYYINAINPDYFVPKSAALMSLDGEWSVKNGIGSINVASRVPGSVYTDLMHAKVIGDPYYRFNDVKYKWIGYENWTFYRNFEVECEVLQKDRILLIFHGLDTVSTITLNGQHVGQTQNMFVRYMFDVKDVLKTNNSVVVSFESAVTYGESQHLKQLKYYVIPPTCPPPIQNGECHINYVRKIQSSFSWDWGPSFPTQGIWKHAEIVGFDTMLIRDITVATEKEYIENQAPSWKLKVNLILDTAKSEPMNAAIAFYLENVMIMSKNVTVSPKDNFSARVSVSADIPKEITIQQWWPNGLGRQYLYKLTAKISCGSENTYKTVKIGFRTVDLVQELVTNSTGLSFYFRVNGVPFFAKGSNWIPADSFPERITPEYTRLLLQSAKDANMNMLRVWGGGMYETEAFYSIADELGIFIWQDMMFAVALYPVNSDYLNSVAVEIQQQVLRLQHHPSLIIWSGNNENEVAIADRWWPAISQRYSQYKADYIKLYVDTIMPIVQKEDPTRPFVVSSPSNGKITESEGWISKNPQNVHYGDVHYYTYTPDCWNWRIYPRARFVSEYGFESYPSFESFANVSEPSDWTYPSSAFLSHRQHHMFGGIQIDAMITKHLKLPSPKCGEKSFKDLLYLSQINQAMSIKTESEQYRRSQSDVVDGKGKTMGSLYWQLNDIWQAPSWASIEYGGKWKMLHYYAKNFFSPVLVSPFVDDSSIKVSVISDLTKELKNISLDVCVYKWSDFGPKYCDTSYFNQPPSMAHIVYTKNMTGEKGLLAHAHCGSNKECFLYFTLVLQDGKQLGPSNFAFLSEPNQAVGLTASTITVTNVSKPFPTTHSTCTFSILLDASHLSAFVWLDAQGIPGRFSDNGFLMVEKSYNVSFYSFVSVNHDIFVDKLVVRSLTDVCKM